MSKLYPMQEWYHDGVVFAKEVQEALAQGKSWEELFREMVAVRPEEAEHLRAFYEKCGSDRAYWFSGYIRELSSNGLSEHSQAIRGVNDE